MKKKKTFVTIELLNTNHINLSMSSFYKYEYLKFNFVVVGGNPNI